MGFSHEKLDVYRVAIGYVEWVMTHAQSLKGIHRPAKDQWLRASQSIVLNIAEGNGRTTEADRRRFFEIARGSVLECAAIQDILTIGNALSSEDNRAHKDSLDRMAAMLTKLGGRGYQVNEEPPAYTTNLN